MKTKTRHFLAGLSSDELQFIAEYLGSCILESARPSRCSRAQLAARLAEFQLLNQGATQPRSADQEHKMILLLEYLCRSGIQQSFVPLRARHAS